jgi:hypothetical protein
MLTRSVFVPFGSGHSVNYLIRKRMARREAYTKDTLLITVSPIWQDKQQHDKNMRSCQ